MKHSLLKKKTSREDTFQDAMYFYAGYKKYTHYITKLPSYTAIEVIKGYYKSETLNKNIFEAISPFIIHEIADPKSGDLLDFSPSQNLFANEVEVMRGCIINEYEGASMTCLDLMFIRVEFDISHGYRLRDEALNYLGISDLVE